MAYNFTKLTEVAMVENTGDNVNLLVEQNNDIKRMNISDIPQRAQADWNETNESSPAFILNKPDLSSIGGGNAAITYFIISGVYIKDENNTTISKAIMEEALNNGIVKLKWSANNNTETTVLSYSIPASGSPKVFYVNSQGTIDYGWVSN